MEFDFSAALCICTTLAFIGSVKMMKTKILCRSTDRWKTGDSLDDHLHATSPSLFSIFSKKISDRNFSYSWIIL